MKLLVAGASGKLGRAVVAGAAARGWTVRAMVRDAARAPAAGEIAIADARDAEAVARAVAGCEAVFSAVGASVVPALGHGWRGFGAVDWPCNRLLVDAARAAGVRRVVYVSVFHTPAMRRLAYVDAHERVAAYLAASGLPHAIIRPTGFFSAIASYVDLARRGPIPEIARGAPRTNPIADEDLAEVCLDALAADEPALEIGCGGPEVLTRRAIGELAFAAIGREPRFRALPASLVRAGAWLGRPFHPRITQFLSFVAAISTRDLVAPPCGQRRIEGAFREPAL